MLLRRCGDSFFVLGCAVASQKIDLHFWNHVAESPAEKVELAARASRGVGEFFAPIRRMTLGAVGVGELHQVRGGFARAQSCAGVLNHREIFCWCFIWVHEMISTSASRRFVTGSRVTVNRL